MGGEGSLVGVGGEELSDGWEAKGCWLGAKGVKGGERLSKGGELRQRQAGSTATVSSIGGDDRLG